MNYRVKEVAKLSGVSIRTLHHYDNIGLLTPPKDINNNYRIYRDSDLRKLQEILLYKEMGFSLKRIKELLSSSKHNRKSSLESQLVFLKNMISRYENLVLLVENSLNDIGGEEKMSKDDLFKGFDYDKVIDDQEKYQEEVEERWGDTDAYTSYKEKTSKYKKEDWNEVMELQTKNLNELASLFKENIEPSDVRVQTVVNNNRYVIDKFFYPCSKEMFGNLGEMYVEDSRFKAFYDDIVDGLAEYYRDAIRIYCK